MRNLEIVAVILAGGKGTRLGVLTNHRTKPAVAFGGRYRIIDWVLSNCLRSQIDDVFCITQFEPISLMRHIGAGTDWGFNGLDRILMNLHPKEQQPDRRIREYPGTADAIRQNQHRILQFKPEYILILAGDHIYSEDYRKIVASHRERESDLTIYAQPVTAEEAQHFGIMRVNSEGRILEFVEKPQDPKLIEELRLPQELKDQWGVHDPDRNYLASMGIYLFNRKSLREQLDDPGKLDFGKDVIPSMLQGAETPSYRLFAHIYPGYWRDVGVLQTYYDTNLEVLDGKYEEIFTDHLRTNTRTRYIPAPLVKGSIHNTIISSSCIIEKGASVEHSLLGYQVVVGENTIIRDSLLLGADPHVQRRGVILRHITMRIGKNCNFCRVIVDKNVRVGNNVRIGETYFTKEERIRRLSEIGLKKDVDYTILDSGLIAFAKQATQIEKRLIPDGFEC